MAVTSDTHGVAGAGGGKGILQRLGGETLVNGAAIEGSKTEIGGRIGRFIGADVKAVALRARVAGPILGETSVCPPIQRCAGGAQVIVIIGRIDKGRVANKAMTATTHRAAEIGVIAIKEVVIFGNRTAAVLNGDGMAGDNGVGEIQAAHVEVER